MLVTVYIPTKNRLRLVQRAINSVKCQTYPRIELIVVDDGSTDGSREYLTKEMKAGALKAIFHDGSLGSSAARNTAIRASKGDLVTGLDDDDYFLSDRRIDSFVEKWNSIGPGFAGAFDSVKVNTHVGIKERHKARIASYTGLRTHNVVGNQVFAPRSHYLDAGLFDTAMPAWQDWDLWIRMSEQFGPFVNMNQSSYMMDEFHGAERITVQNGKTIRDAMDRLSKKLNKLSCRERAYLIEALYGYPQVEPRAEEVLALVMGGRWRLVWPSVRRILA
jgi:glycosyltransferase involved in cell wall biosynthesis